MRDQKVSERFDNILDRSNLSLIKWFGHHVVGL